MENKRLKDLPEHIYIERPKLLKDLVSRLQRDYVVALLGSSGVGKSMLVEGGLLPLLESGKIEGRAGKHWKVVQTQPLADPLGNLAEALTRPGTLYPAQANEISFRDKVEKELRTSPDALQQIYIDAVNANPFEPFNLLIVVDQLEDLKRYNRLLTKQDAPQKPGYGRQSDDVEYISLLLKIAGVNLPVYLIFISDNNYLEHYARYQGLSEAMSQYRYPVGNITRLEMEDSICRYLTGKSFSEGEPVTVATLRQTLLANPNEDPSDPGAKQKQEELKFVDTLLTDYEGLLGDSLANAKQKVKEPDPYAVLKFNLFRVLTLRAWKDAQSKSAAPVSPMDVYPHCGPMQYVVDYFADKVAYPKLDKELCAKFFKGLTTMGGENTLVSQATPVAELQGYCSLVKTPAPTQSLLPTPKREAFRQLLRCITGRGNYHTAVPAAAGQKNVSIVPAPAELQAIIDGFNGAGVRFISHFGTSPALNSFSIIDIHSNVLMLNWDRLGTWIETERTHANVYQNLFRDAIAYYSKNPGVQEGPHLYDSAMLSNARDWEIECNPSEAWSKRYPPLSPLSKLTDGQKKNLQAKLPGQSIDSMNQYAVAMQFLQESKAEGDRLEHNRQLELEKAVCRQKKATVFSIFAFLLVCIATYYWWDARMQKRNLAMVNFIQLLDYNDVLSIQASNKFEVMQVLGQTIRKESNINTNEKVLDMLVRHGILKQDSLLKSINYQALLNMDKLYYNMENGGSADDCKEKIYEIYGQYAQYEKNRTPRTFQQNPPLFNAIYAQVEAKESGFNILYNPDDSLSIQTIINQNCIAATPGNPDFYVFGDRNGIVYLKEANKKPARPLFSLGAPITCLMYNSEGSAYYIGTESGAVYRSLQVDYFTGKQPELIYQSETGHAIYFIGERASGGALLLRAFKSLYWLQPDPKTKRYTKSGTRVDIPLSSVMSTSWSPDKNWVVATGKDRSILYQLNPGGPQASASIVQKTTFHHPQRTILAAALKTEQDKAGNRYLWLACGGMGGRVYLGKLELSALERANFNFQEAETFGSYSVHEAPISGLAFNPGLPQLASSSLEGEIVLCNLDALNEGYDQIKIHNRIQGVSALAYLDKDNLAIYENSTTWVMKTNIEALWEKLDCMYKGCAQ